MEKKMAMERSYVVVCCVLLWMSMASVGRAQNPNPSPNLDYKLALSKSLLFFEGQRSGRLPPTQRLAWRKNSALRDGQEGGVRQDARLYLYILYIFLYLIDSMIYFLIYV